MTRVSTFMVLVAADKNYDIFLTSTPPSNLRFRLMDADGTFKVRLSMFYQTSNRIDLYQNSKYVPPTNARFTNNIMTLIDPKVTNISNNQYMPTYSNASGTNLFVKSQQKMFFTLSGAYYVDLQIAPFLFTKFGVPAITPEAFFDSNTIVANFAALLGLSPSQIRYVQIVRANGTVSGVGRRRRAASDITYIELSIYSNAVEDLVANRTELNAQTDAINAMAQTIVNLYTTGNLQQNALSMFNLTLSTLDVQQVNQTLTQIGITSGLVVVTEPSGCRAQSPCDVQPIVCAVDKNGNRLAGISGSYYPWRVVASLNSTTPAGSLVQIVGQSIATLNSSGCATFQTFSLSTSDVTVTLNFNFSVPLGVNPYYSILIFFTLQLMFI
jgi:hypothetical protein